MRGDHESDRVEVELVEEDDLPGAGDDATDAPDAAVGRPAGGPGNGSTP